MKCPICGETVRVINIIGTEYYNGSYYDIVEGTCSDCGMGWQWVEVYTFDHIEDVIPINVDDHL